MIGILLDMQLFDEALDWTIDALNQLDDGDTCDVLIDQFGICCARMGMNVDSVRDLALKRLCEFTMFDHNYVGDDRMQEYKRSRFENLVDRFNNALCNMAEDSAASADDDSQQNEGEARIAQYGELAIALFEDIIRGKSKSLSRHDLILGYERILNYCKHMGLKGDVADKCISRIAELNSFEASASSGESTVASEALKIYLGQALHRSGEYDVFISYKSEDEVLAKKVYDYLIQSGKEVFFAKETLPQLGNSEYRTAIFDAIERSKHMVVVGSQPDYLKTKWVKKRMEYL